uniref:Uncharacterized protein n=1 Tax=Plectus sambesii TaxID=2011161 RepID=A0A914XM03_9BILA
MGNTSTSVTAGVKNQVNSGSKALYKLANLAGGGELVNLAKIARKTNEFTELDEKIRAEVPRFLYNDGEGAWLSIAEVISTRHKERTGSDFVSIIPNASSKAPNQQNKEGTLKEVCWDLTERGAVGETALHVCFLCGTEDHMVLAKRLIEFYPKLINDVYISDEYFGENVLHMGVVNEDPQVVRFLLHRGANVAQRCSGNFFTCDDQKASRTDTIDHEWVALSKSTRYMGHMYWGEYPLSFAACLSQEECFRLLVAKGASPNWQDT